MTAATPASSRGMMSSYILRKTGIGFDEKKVSSAGHSCLLVIWGRVHPDQGSRRIHRIVTPNHGQGVRSICRGPKLSAFISFADPARRADLAHTFRLRLTYHRRMPRCLVSIAKKFLVFCPSLLEGEASTRCCGRVFRRLLVNPGRREASLTSFVSCFRFQRSSSRVSWRRLLPHSLSWCRSHQTFQTRRRQ